MNTTTQSPNYGTFALLLAVAGLGGWALHEGVGGEARAGAVSTAPVVDRGQAGAQPINLTIVPAAPPRHGHKGRARRVAASPSPLMASGYTGQPTMFASTAPPQSAQPPPIVLVRTVAGGGGSRPRNHASQPPSNDSPSTVVLAPHGDSYQVLATHGAIVYIGENGQLIGNTGPTSASGVVALGVEGSTLQTGASNVEGVEHSASTNQGAAAQGGSLGADPTHANGSFAILMPGAGTTGAGTAISGFEDHSVSVIGNDQIVTYDDSNVLIDRDGQINTNTGDTDSSGLNAVDVVDSYVGSGNSGDGEGNSEEDEAEEDEAEQEEGAESTAPQRMTATDERASTASSDDEDGSGNDEADEDGAAYQGRGPTYATVTDEGASIASGSQSFVVGADGYDDVSIRSRGDRNIVTYDDSNVVIGGTGKVNAQIGDSDTGGAVVMGVRNSHVQAGCEGDLCYSD